MKSRPVTIDLFLEDSAQEAFLWPLVNRTAAVERLKPRLGIRSARGGKGRALAEFSRYQSAVKGMVGGLSVPDLLIVAVDCNCSGENKKRAEIEQIVDKALFPRYAIACPDPHIERWYMADPESFEAVVGAAIRPGLVKCERSFYKQMLSNAIAQAGHPKTLGGKEFAEDLVRAMDSYRAGQNEPSLGRFLRDLGGHMKQLHALSCGAPPSLDSSAP
jgi:hypothetical protein